MSLDCYNRGCNQKYNEENNHAEACAHHPGLPYFHDAYKIWSCCQKKSLDFTQFLDIKGCTKSPHSNKKPELPEKKLEEQVEEIKQTTTEINNKPIEKHERPSDDLPMIKLKHKISSSLQPHLKSLETDQNDIQAETDEVLKVGTTCKNAGCKAEYKSPSSNQETCVHHTGSPIFHEGMKYWTCCQRKTSDFNMFLEQEGCTQGNHLWIKKKSKECDIDRSKVCRFDWFQTGSEVVINVYSKMPIPSLSSIIANPVRIEISIVFGDDKKEFYKEIILNDSIDVETSVVDFMPSKTEITLKKSPQVQWPSLELDEEC